jgi:hypothetical protein
LCLVISPLLDYPVLHTLYRMKLDGKLINAHGPNKGRHINSIHMEHQGLTKKQLNKFKK